MDKAKLFYTEDHEWIEVLDGNKIKLGVTDYAVNQLGDIVYVELPEEDDEFDAEDEIANVESVKSTSEIYSPVAGKVVAVNEALEDEPEKVNEDPYALGWFVELETEGEVDTSELLSLEQYQALIEDL